MPDLDYKVWNRDPSVEQRTFDRASGRLPEMESAKQLRDMLAEVYRPGMRILDVGCAAGHYYNSLRSIDHELEYIGVDATAEYINFAKVYFQNNPKTTFDIADIFDLPRDFESSFDIVFCCNVLLHLPSIEVPLRNLIGASSRYVFVRSLISTNTHTSKFHYSDASDKSGEPTDFVYQNTYSRQRVLDIVSEHSDAHVEFIEDRFDADQINREHVDFSNVQSAVTRIENGVQIAGSKVFEWEWIKITKHPTLEKDS